MKCTDLEPLDPLLILATNPDTPKAVAVRALRRLGHLDFEADARRFADILRDCGNDLQLAEQSALMEFVVPPHWRNWAYCNNCGPVFTPPHIGVPIREEIQHVLFCPWCGIMSGDSPRES